MALDLITGLGRVVFILWELAVSAWRRESVYSFDRTLGTVGCQILRSLMALVLVPLFVAGYLHLLNHYALFTLPSSAVSTWIVAVLAFSFLDYWSHRFSHAVPLLWAIHSVHHQLEELNAVSGGRVSFLNDVVTLGLLFFMAVLGIPLSVTLGVVAVGTLYSVVLHCPFLGSFGWFGQVVASPAFHRLHHGIQPQYLHKNFSISLSFWDRVFGTWVDETVPPKYGLANGFATNSPFRANWQPWVDYLTNSKRTYTAPATRRLPALQKAYLFAQMFLVLFCVSLLQSKNGADLAGVVAFVVLVAVLGSMGTLDGLLRRSTASFYAEAVRVGLLMPAIFFLTGKGDWSGKSFWWVWIGAGICVGWLWAAFGRDKNVSADTPKTRRAA